MTCPDCTTAESVRHHGGYRSSCEGCCARMLAQSPQYAAAEAAGTFTQAYRAALLTSFPTASREEAHQAVRTWARTLQRLADEHRAAERQAQQAAECER